MIELVESNQYRLLNILDYLLNRHHQITAKEAAELNNTSLITSQKDLAVFHRNYKDQLQSEFAHNTLTIHRVNVSTLCIVCRDIYSDSTSLQLFTSIFFHPLKDRHYHSTRLCISDATFYRFIENLNKNLKSHHIKIASHTGKYTIETPDELHLRYYVALLLLESHGNNFECFYIDYQEVKEIVDKMMAFNQRMEETVLTFQSFLLLTFIIRETQGFSLSVSDEIKAVIDEEQIRFPSYDTLKMKYPTMTDTTYTNIFYGFSAVHFPWRSQLEKKYLKPKVDELYQDINEAMNCIFYDEDMKNLLTYLVGYALHFNLKHKLLISRAEYFADQFIKEHPYFTNKFFEVISKHLEAFPVNMTFQAHFIFYLYLINCPQLYMNMDHIRLKVQSDLGKEHIKFIKNTLQSVFKAIDFVNEDYELLIICNATDEYQEDESTFVINDYPTQHDLYSIRKKMKDVLLKRKTLI